MQGLTTCSDDMQYRRTLEVQSTLHTSGLLEAHKWLSGPQSDNKDMQRSKVFLHEVLINLDLLWTSHVHM